MKSRRKDGMKNEDEMKNEDGTRNDGGIKHEGGQTTETPRYRIGLYLGLVALLWVFCFVTLKLLLMPYSVAYGETGRMTAGYLAYAAIGLLFSTPAPFWSVLIIALWRERKSLKAFFRGLMRTEQRIIAIVATAVLCGMALVYALLCGKPNGNPWWMLPAGFVLMLPFVGIAEESGWRGYLQPALEERMPFFPATLLTGAIWYVWHLDLWLDPTSNHFGDSLIGFGITVFLWAFTLAALYRATKSVLACAVCHAFMDAIGAVYDWNALFDAFPGDFKTNAFRVIWALIAAGLWYYASRREKGKVKTLRASSHTGRNPA